MRRSRQIAATALTGTILATALGVSTAAAQDGSTDTTFEVTANGGLAISVPVNEDLGSLGVADLDLLNGGSLTGSFVGDITVTDTRGRLVAEWTTDIHSQDADADLAPDPFVLTALPDGSTQGIDPTEANQRVDAADITYTPDTGTMLVTGLLDLSAVTAVPGNLADGASVSVATSGNNEVSWTPSLDVGIAPEQVAGTYEGVIVHSVS